MKTLNCFLAAILLSRTAYGATVQSASKPYVDSRVAELSERIDAKADATVDAEIPETAAERGVTFIDQHGDEHNGAVEIGRNAIAAVGEEAINAAPSNAVVRNVSVAIGDGADATNPKDPLKHQGIAIGNQARAADVNATAIGSGVKHIDEDDMTGGNAYASAQQATAIGYSAKATAVGAFQFGWGVNDTEHSLQFENVPIVRNGKLQIDWDAMEASVSNRVEARVQEERDLGVMYGSVGTTNDYRYLRLAGYNAEQDSDPELIIAVNTSTNDDYALSFPIYPGSPNRVEIYKAETMDRILSNLVQRIEYLESQIGH